MKLVQIAVAHNPPYTTPSGEFVWGETTLYALDTDGNLWRNDVAGYDTPHWFRVPHPDEGSTTTEVKGATK